MFERRQSYNQNYGPVFRHAIGSFSITSSRRNIIIEGQHNFETEEQLNKIIHEIRLAWQEHLSLERGKLPEKENSNAGNSSSVSRVADPSSCGSR
jgi:hypothetical protein